MSMLYATPSIALLPILIVLFGIGIWSKVAVVFVSAFFPIAINTAVGIRNLDDDLVKAAVAFRATSLQLLLGIPR